MSCCFVWLLCARWFVCSFRLGFPRRSHRNQSGRDGRQRRFDRRRSAFQCHKQSGRWCPSITRCSNPFVSRDSTGPCLASIHGKSAAETKQQRSCTQVPNHGARLPTDTQQRYVRLDHPIKIQIRYLPCCRNPDSKIPIPLSYQSSFSICFRVAQSNSKASGTWILELTFI